jgi:hypothetical protein
MMQKEFSLSNDKVMINFTAKYCTTLEMVISSEGFERVLTTYLESSKKKNNSSYRFLSSVLSSDIDVLSRRLIFCLKMLTTLKGREIIELDQSLGELFKNSDNFSSFIEDFYNFWRRMERYTIIQNTRVNEGLQKVSFLEANSNFSNLILSLYRTISENVSETSPRVYRQLPAGGNAGIIISSNEWDSPEEYELLKDIPFIESIFIDPPFITYPKKNTRSGFFSETFENPLVGNALNPDHWFCYPAKVGGLLAFLYFHRDFMSHGIALSNLFEMADHEEWSKNKPDLVYVFGCRDTHPEKRTVFYDDNANDIMVGYVSYDESIDYFGYMKKMTLTLHNLVMIKRGCLPLHGAMVNIVLNGGGEANIILIGDSGAGKSETLEAFRSLGESYISEMTIVFDDMGILKLQGNNEILASGTEIGAFVRLDDLDPGYAFKVLDRSIFMNPDKINARLVIPITSYTDILKGWKVDMFLYANNYDSAEEGTELEYFSDVDRAIEVFRDGARMAKGTTSELGLVKSYFANPFGPHQKQEETDILIDKYFNTLFEAGVKVGQIKTGLGIPGLEREGPTRAAKRLLEAIRNK